MDEAIGIIRPIRNAAPRCRCLHFWQEQFGFISDEGVRWIAAKLELQPINILELVTFYPMFRQAPAGRKHIRVCRTLSCAMAGSYQVMENLCAAAGIDPASYDDDGMHTPDLGQRGWQIQHRICRMPRQLRHRAGLHGGR